VLFEHEREYNTKLFEDATCRNQNNKGPKQQNSVLTKAKGSAVRAYATCQYDKV